MIMPINQNTGLEARLADNAQDIGVSAVPFSSIADHEDITGTVYDVLSNIRKSVAQQRNRL